MSTINTSIRIDSELKKQAEIMFAQMGLNMSTGINIYLKQVVRQGKIPFEITADLPNKETLEAMQEVDDIISGKSSAKTYKNADELFEDLDK